MATTCSATRGAAPSLTARSHTATAFQPAARKAASSRASRALLSLSLVALYSGRAFGTRLPWQTWPCQKHPRTSTTVHRDDNTMFG